VPRSAQPDLPDLPGFVLTGDGTPDRVTGRVSAVEAATRQRVELMYLPALSADERERIADVLARYAAVDDENLARPVALAAEGDALVLPAAEQVTLVGLDPVPGSAGQAVTLVAPIASALAALHQAGLAHGDLQAGSVGIDRTGRPRLMGAGVQAALHALVPREVPAPTIEDDRTRLVYLLADVAEPVNDPALDTLVISLAQQQAEPARVAEVLLTEVEPLPLGVGEWATARPTPEPEPEPSPEPQPEPEPEPRPEPELEPEPEPEARPARTLETQSRVAAIVRRRPPWLLVAVGAAVAVALLAWVVAARSGDPSTTATSGRTDIPAPAEPTEQASPTPTEQASPTPTPTPTPTATATVTGEPEPPPAGVALCGAPPPAPEQAPELAQDWAEVIRELYVRRSAALVTGQTELLCEVYDPLAEGLVSDLALEAAYAEQGVRPDELAFVVESAELVEQDGALLLVEVTDRLEPYRLLNDAGEVVAELPGIPSETWRAQLVPDAEGERWLFS
jgi:hypothetical protein